MNCTKCHLHKYRRNIVHGRGSLPCDICIVGEAPGMTEDLTGEAFTGRTGQLLDKVIHEVNQSSGFKPRIYFMNILFCRATDSIGGISREPESDETFSCSENVQKILDRTHAKHFIIIGDITEKFIKRRINHYTKLTHPVNVKRHGEASGYYQQILRTFETIFRQVGEK